MVNLCLGRIETKLSIQWKDKRQRTVASHEGIFSKQKHSLRAKPYLRFNPGGTQFVSLRNRGWFSSLAAQWRHVSSHQSLCDQGHIPDSDPLVWGHPRFFTSPQGFYCVGVQLASYWRGWEGPRGALFIKLLQTLSVRKNLQQTESFRLHF